MKLTKPDGSKQQDGKTIRDTAFRNPPPAGEPHIGVMNASWDAELAFDSLLAFHMLEEPVNTSLLASSRESGQQQRQDTAGRGRVLRPKKKAAWRRW